MAPTMPLAALVAVGLAACTAAYTGGARTVTPAQLAGEDGWVLAPTRAVRQRSDNDCGAAALAMVVARWRPALDVVAIADQTPTRAEGLRLGEMRDLARDIGLRAFAIVGDREVLGHELGLDRPVLIGLYRPYDRQRRSHFEVVVGLHPDGRVATIDPADAAWKVRSWAELLAEWNPAGSPALVVLGDDAAAGPAAGH